MPAPSGELEYSCGILLPIIEATIASGHGGEKHDCVTAWMMGKKNIAVTAVENPPESVISN